MAEIIRMPKMSDTMVEGVIANWLKKEGDVIKSGDIIAEVETDKATMELENYEDGTLLYIGVKVGEAVPVDGIIAIVGTPGEDYSSLLAAPAAASAPADVVATEAPAVAPVAETAAPSPAIDLSGVKAVAVRMPKMSDTMVEGVIAKWLKAVGDVIKNGDIIAEVETDKATMELENYEDGTLLYIGAKEGQGVIVDGIIAIVGEPGANYQLILDAEAAPKSAAPAPVAAAPAPAPVASAPAPAVTKAPVVEKSSFKARCRIKGKSFSACFGKRKRI